MMLAMSYPTTLRNVGGYHTTSWRDDSGRRRWRRFGSVNTVPVGVALQEYGRWLTTWAECDAVRNPDVQQITVATLCDRFQNWADGYYVHTDGTQTGEAGNIADALTTAREVIGNLPAATMGSAELLQVRAKMAKNGLARTTINSRISKVRHAFKWGAANQLIPATVYHAMQTVEAMKAGRASSAKEPEPVTPVARELITKALEHMPVSVQRMVRVQLLCGCRPGEVAKMRACDLDRRGRVWTYRPAMHKTAHHGARREIYLGPQAQEIIRPLIGADLTAYLFSPLADGGRATRFGRPVKAFYDRRAYRQAVVRACRAANVPEWSPNQLRHTRATELRAQAGIELARVILGHESCDTTEIYAERDRKAAMDLMRKVG